MHSAACQSSAKYYIHLFTCLLTWWVRKCFYCLPLVVHFSAENMLSWSENWAPHIVTRCVCALCAFKKESRHQSTPFWHAKILHATFTWRGFWWQFIWTNNSPIGI